MQQHGSKYFTPQTPTHPTLTLGGQTVKVQHFQNMVMLHIKLKGMDPRETCKHIFCPYTHPQPVGWIKR